jgi:hypothetical protein
MDEALYIAREYGGVKSYELLVNKAEAFEVCGKGLRRDGSAIGAQRRAPRRQLSATPTRTASISGESRAPVVG